MSKESDKIPDFDDIVFENRNKKYGAYRLRKNYRRNIIFGILTASVLVSAIVITPYIKEKSHGIVTIPPQREVVVKMQRFEPPPVKVVVPPPPPMPHEKSFIRREKYVAPKVVDTVMPIDTSRLMTIAQAKIAVSGTDTTAPLAENGENTEVLPETKQQPFTFVEEMPVFPGGQKALLKYIADHIQYPKVALENNIQGRVIVKFCITAKGGVNQESILKGVSPALDTEALRVVKTLPKFIPGKQSGVPVPVWSAVPITFKLK